MKIISIVPTEIELKQKHQISDFPTNGPYYDIEISNTIKPTADLNWFVQSINVTYIRFNGKKMCGVTVANKFAMNLGDNKLIPVSTYDFTIYGDMTQIAISQARFLFHIEFKNTEFSKDFLPFESREIIIERIKNSVYSVAN